MVPLREHEIQDAEFQSYEERIKNDLDSTVGPDGLPLDAKQIIRRKRKRMKELVIQDRFNIGENTLLGLV